MPLGFNRNDLLAEGALAPKERMTGFRMLTNGVHPIFSFHNFNDRPDDPQNVALSLDDWKFLGPAFKLATKLITEPACLAWWPTLVLGKVKREFCHPGHSERAVLTPVALTPQALNAVRTTFIDLSNGVVRYAFSNINANVADGPKPARWAQTVSSSARQVIEISLSRSIVRFDRNHTHIARIRYFFLVAEIIVHELTHAVSQIKRKFINFPAARSIVRIDNQIFEPFYRADDAMSELGQSWEHFMYGGRISAVNVWTLGVEGLAWERTASKESSHMGTMRDRERYHAIKMTSIIPWFTDAGWTKVKNEGLAALPIILCPTTSIFKWTNTYPGYGRELDRRSTICPIELESAGMDPMGRAIVDSSPATPSNPTRPSTQPSASSNPRASTQPRTSLPPGPSTRPATSLHPRTSSQPVTSTPPSLWTPPVTAAPTGLWTQPPPSTPSTPPKKQTPTNTPKTTTPPRKKSKSPTPSLGAHPKRKNSTPPEVSPKRQRSISREGSPERKTSTSSTASPKRKKSASPGTSPRTRSQVQKEKTQEEGEASEEDRMDIDGWYRGW